MWRVSIPSTAKARTAARAASPPSACRTSANTRETSVGWATISVVRRTASVREARIEDLRLPFDQLFERLANVADGDDLAAGGRLVAGDVALGHEDAREAHLRRFAHAQRRLRGAADLARQADFAKDRSTRANRAIAQARRHGADDREIRRGLVDR